MFKLPMLTNGIPEKKTLYSEYVSDILPVEGYSLQDLGASSDPNKNMYALSDDLNSHKPIVFLQACVHGVEWTVGHAVPLFLEYVKRPPETHKRIFQAIRNTFNFYAIPCANPWAYENNTYNNYNAVNLSVDWGDSFQTQTETQKAIAKVLELKPYAFIDCHTMIQYPADYNCMTVGDWSEAEWVKDANRTLSLSSGRNIEFHNASVSAGPPLPGHPNLTYCWVSRQASYYAPKIKGSIIEVTSEATPQERVNIALNMLLTQIVYYMHKFKTNNQIKRSLW